MLWGKAMSKKLFSHDAEAGITKWWHYDAATDKATIETVQDVQGILDHNKAQKNSGVNNKDHGLGKKVASVPLTLYYQWKAEAKARGLDSKEEGAMIMAKLKSREYCHLLTVDKI